jgi:hypothetical protein
MKSMRKLICGLSLVFSAIVGFAQTTVTTTHTNNNGNGSVIFNVQNTNVYDIIVTGVQCHLNTTATNNVELLYRNTPFSDFAAPWDFGIVGAGQNGWLSAGTGQVLNTNTANGIVPALTGLFLIIPAGQTYQFGFSGTTIQYMTLTAGAGTNTFTAGGVSIITGDGISWGGVAYPATPANYPRGFIGGITFIQGTPCSGAPTAGTTTAAANPVCPSVGNNLTLTGATQGTGLTYQWQSSLDGVTFTPISGATNSSYLANQTVNTYYNCVVTCGANSSTSTNLLVNTSTFINCYCNSSATSPADEEILGVSIGTMNNTSTCASTGGPGSVLNMYSNYTTTVAPPLLAQTVSYPFSVNIGTCGGNYGNMTKVFIDYNQNGLFTDPGEEVYFTPIATTGPHIVSGSIVIPATALTGQTRMRVINVETTLASSILPCGTYTWGETEDYFVFIAPAPTCPQPTNFNLISAANNTADVQWLAGGAETQWEIQYGPVGFSPGNGTSVIVNTNPYTLTGLNQNSFYSAYVRAICTPGDSSYWAGPISFNTYGQGQYMEWNTECGPGFTDISANGTPTNLLDDAEIGVTLPFNFLFQGVAMNNVTIADNGGIVLGTTSAQLGFGNGLVSAAPVNSLLAFWDDVQNSSIGNIYYQTVGVAPNQQFIVQWDQQNYWPGSTPSEAITYQIILDQATNEIYYVYEDAVFGGATATFDNGASATIGVNGPNQDVQISLDNASFLQNNTCAHFYYTDCPKPTNFSIAYITPEEVAFSWAAGIAAETNWTVVYGPSGFDPATGGTTLTTQLSVMTLPGLTQNTQYDVYIFADCSPTLQSLGLFGTFITQPFCSNPSGMINNVEVDSIISSWNWVPYSPAYPVTGFNIVYGMSNYDPYTEGTEFSFDADFNDTLADPALLGGGVYQVFIQAVCGADTSQYIGPFTVIMPLSNDSVCGAELLMANGTEYIFNNAGATVQPNESTIAPPATGAQTTTGWVNSTLNNTTWFKFVAPSSGNVRVNQTGLPYNGQSAVYESTGCSDFGLFDLVSANDNDIDGSSLAPNYTVCGLTPGTEYYLLHDGSTAASGNYSITITPIILEAGSFTNILDVCSGDAVNLFDGITGNDAGGVWLAELPVAGTGIYEDSMFSSAGLAYQVFDFEYRVSEGCAYDSIVALVDVYGPSSAGGDGTITVCRNQPVDLLAGLTGNVDFGGTWYDPSNQALSNSEIIASNIPGQFNFDYITGNGVCPDDTANVLLTVDASCNYLSLEDMISQSFNVFPNPTNGVITLSNGVTLENSDISVRDMEGRLIKTRIIELTTSSRSIDLSQYVTGVYFIHVSMNGFEKVFKVVKH